MMEEKEFDCIEKEFELIDLEEVENLSVPLHHNNSNSYLGF